MNDILAELNRDIEERKERRRASARLSARNNRNPEKRAVLRKTTYERNKQKAVELLGNKCCDCQQEYPLCVYDFHHRDPKTKEFEVGQILLHGWDKIEAEVLKCDLVCANCHRIRHTIYSGSDEAQAH